MQIDLSKNQCKDLVDLMDLWLFREIREDTEMDNLDYLWDVLDAYKKFKIAYAEEG